MTKTNFYYFAYGSNLSQSQMLRRCPHAKVIAKAKLKDYRLTIGGYSPRWHGGGATVVKQPNSEVWGVVYGLDRDCLLRLDGFEGVKYKRSSRQHLDCYFVNGKKRRVVTYVRERKKFYQPAKRYKATIIRGARHFELPPSYIDSLIASL